MSASVALAADTFTGGGASPRLPAATGGDRLSDISGFVGRNGEDSLLPRFRIPIRMDPFGDRWEPGGQPAVASQAGGPTVPSSSAGGRRLTAILIADERRVAVIDDATVRVGDVLRDGARVSAILPDWVMLVAKNGGWRKLTLTNRGQ